MEAVDFYPFRFQYFFAASASIHLMFTALALIKDSRFRRFHLPLPRHWCEPRRKSEKNSLTVQKDGEGKNLAKEKVEVGNE